MPASLNDLKSQIQAAEAAVREADARADESARQLKAHWRRRLPTVAIGAASAFVAFQLLRSGRKARALRAGPPPSWSRTIGPLLRYAGPQLTTALSALIAGVVAKKTRKPLATAPHVDLERFSGTWFEIARMPEKWEKDCESDVTVTYEAMADGGLRVIHRCRRSDGSLKRTIGRAEVTDPDSNAKLRISYAPQLLDALPFVWSRYCIVDVAADYSTAVLGTPDRAHLWLLARETTVSEDVRSAFMAKALGQEFDTSQLIYAQHSQPAAASTPGGPAGTEAPQAPTAQAAGPAPHDSHPDRVVTSQGERTN
jgi:apolipoprotein D and lipocalin family protein